MVHCSQAQDSLRCGFDGPSLFQPDGCGFPLVYPKKAKYTDLLMKNDVISASCTAASLLFNLPRKSSSLSFAWSFVIEIPRRLGNLAETFMAGVSRRFLALEKKYSI